ncbi:FixH family protein [Paenibacillus sonchi]|uniref:FixH family protein n=1 Tax=Paenibacillus sonchi TaxID=373687 RepID=UPI001E3DC14B|nr:FixH family protein [Paenibacillus sonchi]MCE3201325.1 FixH family protein [Paenibacillus sonchi]
MLNPRKLTALLSLIIAATLSGCSGGNGDMNHMHAESNMSMEPIKVELSWSPLQVAAGQKVVFEALVTQEGQPVDDAKEVLFEIVSNNNSESKLEFTGESAGNGIYKAEGTMEAEGEFTVTSHVTARTQHSMPSKKLVVQP